MVDKKTDFIILFILIFSFVFFIYYFAAPILGYKVKYDHVILFVCLYVFYLEAKRIWKTKKS